MTNADRRNDDVFEKIAAASAMVAALCEGNRQWFMSIPARVDHDPDLVISNALHSAKEEIETLRSLLKGRPLGAARDALQKDAARYRWLRGLYFGVNWEYDTDDNEHISALVFQVPSKSVVGADIDATIDAALAVQP